MILTTIACVLTLGTSSSALLPPTMGDLEHGAEVTTMKVIDGKLYASGKFARANRKLVNNIAVWDGNNWSGLGKGVDGIVYDFCKVGNDLYVCGDFNYVGKSNEEPGIPANRIARWDGTKWNALAKDVVDREIFALATDGKSLFIGGNFTKINGDTETRAVAKWNGAKLEAIGGKFDRFIKSMVWANDKLYVGGYFKSNGDDEINNAAVWDGKEWSEMGNGGIDGTVARFATDGKSIFAAGAFKVDGKQGIAKFDGSKWTNVVPTNGETKWVAVQDGKVYLAGDFTTAFDKPSHGVAIAEGSKLSALDEVRYAVHRSLVPFGTYNVIGGRYGDVGNDQVGGVLKWNGSSSIDKLELVSDK